MCRDGLPECKDVHHMCGLCLRRSEEGIEVLRIEAACAYEPPCGSWDLMPGPL